MQKFFYLVFISLVVLAGEVGVTIGLFERELAVFFIPALVACDMVRNFKQLEQDHRAERPVLIALAVAVEIIFPRHARP